jgi:nucleotide-binding universal stress UspA family protein
MILGLDVVHVFGNRLDVLVGSDFQHGAEEGGRGAIAAEVAGQAVAELDVAGVDATQVAEGGQPATEIVEADVAAQGADLVGEGHGLAGLLAQHLFGKDKAQAVARQVVAG